MHHIGKKDISLWDDEDAFYYDAIQFENGTSQHLKIRSLAGIIPLLAVDIMHAKVIKYLRQFNTRLEVIRLTRPDLTRIISAMENKNKDGNYLFAIMVDDRFKKLLKRLLDEAEFLSDYGIRSLSRCYKDQPYVFEYQGSNYSIQYEPGESCSGMFGGNSNWRGPIWLPLNYLDSHQSCWSAYHFKEHHLFYEFFNGDTGQGLGASQPNGLDCFDR
ncbi:MAG: hypothetical protein ABI472_05500 [Ginsengibacter sp.]